MIYFLDASAWVKRYIEEQGSDFVRGLIRRRADVAVSRISAIEVPAAFARRVRAKDLSRKAAQAHASRLAKDLFAVLVVEPRPPVFKLAGELVWRHPLRAYDALQLASALHLCRAGGVPMMFVCADGVLSRAATAEGLKGRKL